MAKKNWRFELLDEDLEDIRTVADDMDEFRKKLLKENRLDIEHLIDLEEMITDLHMYIRGMERNLKPLDQEFKLSFKSRLRSLLTRS